MSHASAPHENASLAPPGGFDADLAFLARWAGPLGLLARAMLAYVFFVEGVGKIVNYADVVGYMQSYGVDGRLLPLAILTEVGGSLLVLAGFKTRWAAVALSGFCVLAALLFHLRGGPDETLQLQKDIAIGGGLLALALFGAGPWSIDAWRSDREAPSGPPPRWRRNHGRARWPSPGGTPCSSTERPASRSPSSCSRDWRSIWRGRGRLRRARSRPAARAGRRRRLSGRAAPALVGHWTDTSM